VTTNFIGIIINGFGYPQLKSLLLQAPAFAIQAAVCLLVTGLVTFTTFFRNAKQPLLSIAACAVVAGTAVIYSHQPTPDNRQLLLGMMCKLCVTVIFDKIGSLLFCRS
jgi:ACS family allantoate permease-like MFS transporter